MNDHDSLPPNKIASDSKNDDENGASYVVRAMKLMESEASVTNNVTPIDMVIEHFKGIFRS